MLLILSEQLIRGQTMGKKDTVVKTEDAKEDEELEEGEINDEGGEKDKNQNRTKVKICSPILKQKRKLNSLDIKHKESHCNLNKRSSELHSCKKLPEHDKRYNASLPMKSVVHARHSRNSLSYSKRMSLNHQARQNSYSKMHLLKRNPHTVRNIYYTNSRLVRQHIDFSREARKVHQTPRRDNFNDDESYENLLRQYKRIQFQLEDLRRKEQKDRETKRVTTFCKGERITSEKENHYQKYSNKEKRGRRSSSKISDNHLGKDAAKARQVKKRKVSQELSPLPKKNPVEQVCSLSMHEELQSIDKIEEDEDELELRRKALASRNKFVSAKSNVLESNLLDDQNDAEEKITFVLSPPPPPLPSLSPPPSPPPSPSFLQDLPALSMKIDNFRDNYDLVDMELDSDIELNNSRDDLKISFEVPQMKNEETQLSTVHETIDEEDVDIETLREQLLSSIAKRKITNIHIDTDMIETADCREISINCEEVKLNCEECKPNYEQAKRIYVEETINNKVGSVESEDKIDTSHSKSTSMSAVLLHSNTKDPETPALVQGTEHSVLSRASSPLEFNPKQTLVINLRDDSSSDESDINTELFEARNEINDQNVPAGLDLLLKEARMKADMKSNLSKNIASTPAAVYRLSKAQQLEYKKLKEMIAKKESNYTPVQSSIRQQMSLALPSLEVKLNIARATLQKEKQLEHMLRIQLNKKKAALRRAQLSVQQLKEQLRVAEKVVVGNLQMIHKTNLQLRTVQSSVDKRNKLVLNLERECKQLGFRIYGSAYHPKGYLSPFLSRRFQVKCVQ